MPLLKTNSFLFIFLALTTFISHTWIERYQQTGPDLIGDAWKINAAKKNRAEVNGNQLTLFATDSSASVSIYQNISVKPRTLLKFSADVKHDNVMAGKKPWNEARLILVQNDGKKYRWDLSHIVTSLTGTGDWENYYQYFYIIRETQETHVAVELNRSTGAVQVKNIQLYPIEETRTYWWMKSIILVSWGVFLLMLVGSCLLAAKESLFSRALLAAAFISIVIGTSLPGYIKDSLSYTVETQLDLDHPEFKTIIPWDLSDVWHVGVFFLLGLVLGLMLKKQSLIHTTLIILMMAGGTEIMQLYIAGRSPQVSDFFIDAAGGIVGIALIRLFSLQRRSR
jgi:VanZ family protein